MSAIGTHHVAPWQLRFLGLLLPVSFILGLSLDAVAGEPPHNQLALDGIIVGPSQRLMLRYGRVLDDIGTTIEPGVGLGVTGYTGSMLLQRPFLHWNYDDPDSRSHGEPSYVSLGIYAGYSLGLLGGSSSSVWSTTKLRHGSYHWLEVGLGLEERLGIGLFGEMLVGVSYLVHSPAEVDLEETFTTTGEALTIGKSWTLSLGMRVGWAF